MTSVASGAVRVRPDAQVTVYRALTSALSLSCLRTHGPEVAVLAESEAVRREHATMLAEIDLGELTGSPVERCARAHLALDGHIGVPAEAFRASAGRTWLRYRPPHWFGHGLHAPSAAVAVLDSSMGQAWFRARHAVTAARLGSPTVAFVHTHDMTDGDPLNAGYFVDRGVPLDEGDRYVREHDVALPDPAALEVMSEPASANTIRWSPQSGAALRMAVLGDTLGPVGAAAIIEHAWRIVLGAYWAWLPGAFGVAEVRTPLDAARLYAAVLEASGTPAEVESCGDDALVHHEVPHAVLPGAVSAAGVQAMVNGWSAILPNFAWELRAVVVNPPSSASPSLTVRFDRHGPQG